MKSQSTNIMCNCLRMILIWLRQTYDCVVDTVFTYCYKNIEVKKLPSVAGDDVLIASASTLARKIRQGQISAEDVVRAFVERIQKVNGIVNAVVDERFEEALNEARLVDKLIADKTYSEEELETKFPLLGVPFTSKESTSSKGMSFTCGMVNRRNEKADEDAAIVKSMKDAGAILLAVTNIPELNLWVESRNRVFGQTLNPYNTNRTVGGSSGGEACIVTSCGSPLGLGTDIGGSARIPAFCCGVYAHKMTGGLINIRGLSFRTGLEKHTMVAAGPIARYASDLKPVIRSLAQPEKVALLRLDAQVDVKKLKYFYVMDPGDPRVSPIGSSLKGAMMKAVNAIANMEGIESQPQQVSFPGFKYSYSLWRYWMSKEESNFSVDITNKKGVASFWQELPKKILGQSDYSLSVMLKLLDLELPLPNAEWAEKETDNLRNSIIEKLGSDGVLLFPSYPSVAPYHYVPFFRPYNFAYWAIINALQFPATQIPLGLDKDGLPLGIQIIAGPYQDRLGVAVAEKLEEIAGGWVAPFVIDRSN